MGTEAIDEYINNKGRITANDLMDFFGCERLINKKWAKVFKEKGVPSQGKKREIRFDGIKEMNELLSKGITIKQIAETIILLEVENFENIGRRNHIRKRKGMVVRSSIRKNNR